MRDREESEEDVDDTPPADSESAREEDVFDDAFFCRELEWSIGPETLLIERAAYLESVARQPRAIVDELEYMSLLQLLVLEEFISGEHQKWCDMAALVKRAHQRRPARPNHDLDEIGEAVRSKVEDLTRVLSEVQKAIARKPKPAISVVLDPKTIDTTSAALAAAKGPIENLN